MNYPEGIPLSPYIWQPKYWFRRLFLLFNRHNIISTTKNDLRVEAFHNRHHGERCFIIGNGPSLKNTDLTKLANEFSFGMNRFYLLFPDLNFQPTYYVSVNLHVLEQFSQDFAKLSMPVFVPWYAFPFIKVSPQTHFLKFNHGIGFSKNIHQGLWTGVTVTYVALQIAYYMGFETVYLIGVDHKFKTSGQPHKLIKSDAGDENHFSKDYFGKGIRWQLPDLAGSELNYQLAKSEYEIAGRQIIDATVNGDLTVFQKVHYSTLF